VTNEELAAEIEDLDTCDFNFEEGEAFNYFPTLLEVAKHLKYQLQKTIDEHEAELRVWRHELERAEARFVNAESDKRELREKMAEERKKHIIELGAGPLREKELREHLELSRANEGKLAKKMATLNEVISQNNNRNSSMSEDHREVIKRKDASINERDKTITNLRKAEANLRKELRAANKKIRELQKGDPPTSNEPNKLTIDAKCQECGVPCVFTHCATCLTGREETIHADMATVIKESSNVFATHDSNSFVKHDAGKRQFSLIPTGALGILADVYTMGAVKYKPWNWVKGSDWSRIYDAAQRHMTAFWGGENLDQESGLPHIMHSCWGMFTLCEFMLQGLGNDNRYKQEKKNNGL